jgi:hypothetical protein
VLRTKYDHWRYEEEFRYFVLLADCEREVNAHGKELHFYSFGDTLTLAEVILGPCFDFDALSLDDAKRLVEEHCPKSVTTFRTRLASQWFAVVPHEDYVP